MSYRLPRVHILSSLFSEATDTYGEQLTSSLAGLKVFLMPFCRDVKLDDYRICAMARLVEQCRLDRGVFVVAPEHRLSMELKVIELQKSEKSKLGKMLYSLCQPSNWRNVLDESDELLHHRYQLIYAWGLPVKLPEGLHRFRAAHLLLRIVREDTSVRTWIDSHPEFITFAKEQTDSKSHSYFGSCPRLLNLEAASHDNTLWEFNAMLADAILAKPPVELDWLRDHHLRNDIKAVLIDPTASAGDLCSWLSRDQLADVLSFRGLLAAGILTHCLQKRHRVEYGIARPGKRRIAVPFHGADTPSLRAEFSQADCALVFSFLAVHSDGLDEHQLRETFETLLSLGKVARREHYLTWYEQAKPHIPNQKEADKMDCVEKIDLTNTRQYQNLMFYFSRNMHTIDFWLSNCVFPDEMQSHPQRMTATAWCLAESSGHGAIGFSGTNDNHRTLPQQVQQYFYSTNESYESEVISHVWKKIAATNGLMLSHILTHT
jgi:Protein of unknown function (DUF3638)/Protein of unknown function (DUF3645)